jgi:uncharacterized membrane protein YraQ (UPF0718 family)
MILEVLTSVLSGILHLWPFLLVTVPLAVLVRQSGAARLIERAMRGRPVIAILLATAVGAFSPFCSCSVIPVVATLLWSGVPLGPVMSFWIASPSMDPEIFFLSVASLGWQLALWRLGSTLVLSLAAGFVTQALFTRGWLGTEVLRPAGSATALSAVTGWVRAQLAAVVAAARRAVSSPAMARLVLAPTSPGCCGLDYGPAIEVVGQGVGAASCGTTCATGAGAATCGTSCDSAAAADSGAAPCACGAAPRSAAARLVSETVAATLMVAKFMALAVTLEVLFKLFVPTAAVTALVGTHSRFAVVTAAAVGVPLYTSNLAAMPLVRELLASGMDPAAALAFLIAGPTTTIPAMAAVAGLVNRRVFALYVGYAFFGAILAGLAFAAVRLI